jgi:Tfp pilus assembly protein PilX
MKTKKYKKKEEGFVLVLAILLLLVMSLTGTTLVVIASNDYRGNTLRDHHQQTLYAAETGIQEAKRYLSEQVKKGQSLNSGAHPDAYAQFCKTIFFTSLNHETKKHNKENSVKAIILASNKVVASKRLDNLMSSNDKTEKNRLAKYQYEYFITHTPRQGGYTDGINIEKNWWSKQVASTSSAGTNISESASYNQSASSLSTSYYFTIFSCGKGENDIIVPIEAVVLVPQ